MTTALRKWGPLLIPLCFLLLFAVALNSGDYLKRPMGRHDDIPGTLHRLEQTVVAGDWTESAAALQTVSRAMTAVRPRIELSVEHSELQRFEETLSLLSGALSARDKASSLQHVALLKLLYSELGR